MGLACETPTGPLHSAMAGKTFLPHEIIFDIIDFFRDSSLKQDIRELRRVCRLFKQYIDRYDFRILNVFQNESQFQVSVRQIELKTLKRALRQNREIMANQAARSRIEKVQILAFIQTSYGPSRAQRDHMVTRTILQEFLVSFPPNQIKDLRFHFADHLREWRAPLIKFLEQQNTLERLEWNCSFQWIGMELSSRLFANLDFPHLRDVRFYQVKSEYCLPFITALLKVSPAIEHFFVEMIDPLLKDTHDCEIGPTIGSILHAPTFQKLKSIGFGRLKLQYCLASTLHFKQLSKLELLDCVDLGLFLPRIDAKELRCLSYLHIRDYKTTVSPETAGGAVENFIAHLPSALSYVFLILKCEINLSCLDHHFGTMIGFVYDIIPQEPPYFSHTSIRKSAETFSKLSPYFTIMKNVKELGLSIAPQLLDSKHDETLTMSNDTPLDSLAKLRSLELLQVRNAREYDYYLTYADMDVSFYFQPKTELLYREIFQSDAEAIAKILPSLSYILVGYNNSRHQLKYNAYEDVSSQTIYRRICPVLYSITKTTGFVSQVFPTHDEQGHVLRRKTDNSHVIKRWDELKYQLVAIGIR